MNKPSMRKLFGTFFAGLCALALSGWAHADPPLRVARLAYIAGPVSFSPGGERDWVQASVNRPLIAGDRLWADAGARAELQLGGAAMRLGASTNMVLANVDDRMTQVQLVRGILNIRVWQLDRDQVYEIDTPNLAYSIRKPGSYRIEVGARGESTAVLVRSGLAEVFGEGRAFVVNPGQGFEFFDTGLRDYSSFAPAPADEFDRWAISRDRRWENSVSARYVSRDLIGYEDLDEYGTWREAAGFGNVWTPTRVAANWAPYRDGRWAWVEPWGWTWVDDAPWGFAPSHYGRWANIEGAWAWVPGPVEARPVYAPALVAFVGGSNFGMSFNLGNSGAVAWFPLGPRDVYRPWYPASRDYFHRVNASNTVINSTTIVNVYNSAGATNATYVNQRVPGAVVAVPTATFVQSRSVAPESVRVTPAMLSNSLVTAVAPVAPVRTSVLGSAALSNPPPVRFAPQPVVARTPASPPASFATREGALSVNAARPFETAASPTHRAFDPGARAATPTPQPAMPVPQRLVNAMPSEPLRAAPVQSRSVVDPAASRPAVAPRLLGAMPVDNRTRHSAAEVRRPPEPAYQHAPVVPVHGDAGRQDAARHVPSNPGNDAQQNAIAGRSGTGNAQPSEPGKSMSPLEKSMRPRPRLIDDGLRN